MVQQRADPFEIVNLAIRLDETSREAETLLKEPLETAKVHEAHPEKFIQAYCFLHHKTALPELSYVTTSTKDESNTDNTTSEAKSPAETLRELSSFFQGVALTPIILSGLLTCLQGQREYEEQSEASKKSLGSSSEAAPTEEEAVATSASSRAESNKNKERNNTTSDLSSQLFLYSINMRKLALRRAINRQRTASIQRIILPSLSLLMLISMYLVGVSDMKRVLADLQFVHSCDNSSIVEAPYFETCRLADAYLWVTFRDYLHTIGPQRCDMETYNPHSPEAQSERGNPCAHALLEGRYVQSPFSLHTAWRRELITLDELDGGPKRKLVHSKGGRFTWLSESLVHAVTWVKSREVGHSEITILDAGCGIGGSLYYFVPAHDEETILPFSYTGISISKAEINFAEYMARFHQMDTLLGKENVSFQQKSFDDSLPQEQYSLVLAFESLSYSVDLQFSVRNLLSSLKPGGMMLIADDIIEQPALDSPPFQRPKHQPSLMLFQDWKAILEGEGCQIRYIRDLAMDYEMDDDFLIKATYSVSDLIGYPWETLISPIDPAARTISELQVGTREAAEAMRYRKHLYESGQTSYFLLACVKVEVDDNDAEDSSW